MAVVEIVAAVVYARVTIYPMITEAALLPEPLLSTEEVTTTLHRHSHSN